MCSTLRDIFCCLLSFFAVMNFNREQGKERNVLEVHQLSCLYLFIFKSIYLAALDLSSGMQDLFFVAACGI